MSAEFNALLNNLAHLTVSRTGEAKGSTNGKTSWLHAIAEALGEKLGDLAKSMVANSKLAGSSNEKIAAGATARLTADSQLFSMYMNAVSTVLKSIGEGNSAMARKQ